MVINEKAPIKICLAAQSSQYKNAIVDGLIEHYRDRCRIDVLDIRNINKISTDDYRAVVLINTAMAWTLFNMRIKRFVRKAEDRKKIVIFLSAADPVWKVRVKDVDGLSAASVMANTDDTIKKRLFPDCWEK